ncbi:MAG TPA: UvrB/UvrC motif-containing protein [Patescibacteria group bacterium]|nr:UvrB/UvrC motif-containing protein [Patescibacteria group bacterium]
MYWANFLHFYQPPTQKPFWVKKVTTEAYRPILRGLLAHPNAKLTLNINAILVELLEQNGETDCIDMIRELVRKGQIELTASAKYHPLLPRIPESEMIRQIELNNATHKKYFGDLYQPRGFFPPEMAFSEKVAKVVAKMGYEWIIVDELSFSKTKPADYHALYEDANIPGFKLYFRERKMSWKILGGQLGTGDLLVNELGSRLNDGSYLLTAMDGETFGHHRPGMEHLLFEIYESQKIQTATISELPNSIQKVKKVRPLPSTWALMQKDLERNVPFSRWDDEGNDIHHMQWELTNLAIKAVHEADQQQPGFAAARELLDRAIHSDQYWWASAKPWWSLEMIERGAKELRDTVHITPGVSTRMKNKAQELYQNIIFMGFEWQRTGKVEELAHQEDEEVRQMTDNSIVELPKDQIEKVIANLSKEIETVVAQQEFERAAQLRDRVKELRTYMKEE